THSVFWGSMAYTLIGGTAVGTVLVLLFLPALYAAWFRINAPSENVAEARATALGSEFGFTQRGAHSVRAET
ncbi:MAG: hypothetical protein ABI963_14125, partial [Rhizomicrobium sp.]